MKHFPYKNALKNGKNAFKKNQITVLATHKNIQKKPFCRGFRDAKQKLRMDFPPLISL